MKKILALGSFFLISLSLLTSAIPQIQPAAAFNGPSLDVTTPDFSGQNLSGGQNYTIRWNLMNFSGFGSVSTTITLRQRDNNGSSRDVRTITTSASSRSGSNEYMWVLPNDLSGNNYRFLVQLNQSYSDGSGNSYFPSAESREFSISSGSSGGSGSVPGITVLTPNGGETLGRESNYQIRWRISSSNSFDTYQTVIKLLRFSDNGNSEEIQDITNGYTSSVGENTFSWFVNRNIENGSRYRIRVRLAGFSGQAIDDSNGNFTIGSVGSGQNIQLNSVSPTSGGIGTQITLYGTNFTGSNDVHFGNGIMRSLSSFNNGTSISFTLPSQMEYDCPSGSACFSGQYFVNPGTYNIYVTNFNGTSNSVSFSVTGGNNNNNRSVFLSSDRTGGNAPLGVNFTATLFNFQRCGITYTWDFGDGQNFTLGEGCTGNGSSDILSSRTLTQFHTYQNSGNYTARILVDGVQSNTVTITVNGSGNNRSVFLNSNSTSGQVPFNVNFNASLFNFSSSSSCNFNYTWNFGDGTSSNGSVPCTSNNVFQFHTYQNPGSYQARITVDGVQSNTVTVNVFGSSNNQNGITVLTPNGGETLRNGDFYAIQWRFNDGISDSNTSYNTIIELLDNFNVVSTISSTTSRDDLNTYSWLIPNNFNGSNFRVRVRINDNRITQFSDDSDNPFSINSSNSGGATLRVQNPNGGETLRSGDSYLIRWSFDDGISGSSSSYRTRITLLDSNSEALIINSNALSSDGSNNSYNWFVPNGYNGSNFRIRIQTDSSPFVSDQSDSTFTINNQGNNNGSAFVRVTSPNGGEFLTSNNSYQIQWQFNDGQSGNTNSYRTRIALLNNSSETLTISSNVSSRDGNNTFNWTVPSGYSGNNFKIRVEVNDTGIPFLSDDSDNTFQINGSSNGNSNAPVIDSVSGPTFLNVNQTGTFTIQARDPQNGSLNYRVNWGDDVVVTNTSSASSSSNNFLQTATFTHQYNRNGVFTVTFTVTDNQNLTATSSLTVNVGTGTGNGNGNNNRQIEISNFAFVPSTLTIPAGTTITWVNRDSSNHNIVSDTSLFNSGILSQNQTYSYTFNQTGTYNYHCGIHPNMTGTIIVTSGNGNGNVPLPPAGFEDEVLVNNNSFSNPFRDTNINTLEGMAAAELYRRGVIGGFPDGEFKGNRLVNRAETAKFLLLTRYGSVSDVQNNTGRCSDVLNGQWYTKYFVAAINMGIMEGYPDGFCRPQNNINRAEFLKMITIAFGLQENLTYNYSDVSSNDWFSKYAGTAQRYNMFPNTGSQLNPSRTMTRNEIAVAIYQYLLNR